MITYEYPLNERTRTLLRLEYLFAKVDYFARFEGQHEHHTALISLFEVLDILSRADLKAELIQELERQRQSLLSYRNNPGISEAALSGVLYEIEQCAAGLLSMNGKLGQHLRDNDWLMSVKSRAAIPGGVCEFDLPSYHWWLNRAVSTRQTNIESWLKPMALLRSGTDIVLRLLRGSGTSTNHHAIQGCFQMNLSGSTAQMVRLQVDDHEQSVPEVSANKYFLNVRFAQPPVHGIKARFCERDIFFDLILCGL